MNRKKSSSSNPPFVDGKHNMTSLQLCEGDDLATMMTVDAVLGFTTHKMDKNYNPSAIDRKTREKWKETMQEFIADLNYDNAYNQLIASEKVKSNLKKDERFKRHIFRFLYLFDKRSGIKISPCFRYENEGRKGAAIFATKEWERGSQISTLFGCIAEMSPEEEEIFHESKNEFSVMYSTRKNCSQLWLGPAAYVNHDCKPNCRFTEGNDDSKMTLETLRDIHPGDELLIYYGNNFFGTDNAECECFTCELRDQGLFSRNFQNSVSRAPILLNGDSRLPKNEQLHNGSLRHIATRSCKLPPVMDLTRLSLPNTLNGCDRLKRSDETYSLRVTYSRIDRFKKRILSRTVLQSSNGRPPSASGRDPLKPKLVRQKCSSKINGVAKSHYNCDVVTAPSLRRSQRQAGVAPPLVPAQAPSSSSMASTGDCHWGKLTIKLRKNARAPGQYEQHRSVNDDNIFSRIHDLYLCQAPDSGGGVGSIPPQPMVVIDTPPCLSPWFCSSSTTAALPPCLSVASGGHRPVPRRQSRRPRQPQQPQPKQKRSPFLAATPASDIPSSPTIPVLEIESDTDQLPPLSVAANHSVRAPSVLVCQLREPPMPNSPNKGIVMKFSRISGDQFTSLFTS